MPNNSIVDAKIKAMKDIAFHSAAKANGSPKLIAEIEKNLNQIAQIKLMDMAPVNENLLGFAFILLAEIKRIRQVK